MSTVEINKQIHHESAIDENDPMVKKARKRGRKLSRQALDLAAAGIPSAVASERVIDMIYPLRGDPTHYNPELTQQFANDLLAKKESGIRVELTPGERDEFGIKREFDTITVHNIDEDEHHHPVKE